MTNRQDYTVGMSVRVRSIGKDGRLAAIGTRTAPIQFSSGLGRQSAWYVFIEDTSELRLFAIDQIEPIE